MVDRDTKLIRRIDAILAADTGAWGIPVWTRWWLLLLPLVATVALVAAAPHPRLYHFLIDEDHIVEWSQFFAILAAGVTFGLAGRQAWRSGRRTLAIFFALVAVGAFVVAGEEISWGQRILGLKTPDALTVINQQGETNVHNISGVQRIFNMGELLVGLYGFLVPILFAFRVVPARLAARVDRLIVPPIALASLFFLPFAYRIVRATVLPTAGERITEFGELPELTLYLGILITGVLIARSLRRRPDSARG